MIEYTKQLAKFMAELKYDDLPSKLVTVMKRCLLDTLGCAVAGENRPEIQKLIYGIVNPGESGMAVIWGSEKSVPMLTALMVNGSMNHAVELDDLHKPSKIHAGTVIVPPVVTVGSVLGASGKDILLAMAAGYETTLRIAMAIGVDSHRRRGWHGTATCGSFGAAVAIGKLLKLDEMQMANALGLAGTSTGGLMAYTADGSMSKRYHAGNAAVNGWLAASAAKAGYTGPTYVLEASDGGYAHAASDAYNLNIAIDGLGQIWHSMNIGYKYYACCGHIHQAIDCAIRLRNENQLELGNIKEILVRTYDISGMAWGFQKPPKNTVEAQFSFPYAIAVALIDGEAFLPQFAQDRLYDDRILSLAGKVKVITDDKYSQRYPNEWCSSLEITLTNGCVLTAETCGAKGDPVNPLSKDELDSKFRSLTGKRFSDEKQSKFIALVDAADRLVNIRELQEYMKF